MMTTEQLSLQDILDALPFYVLLLDPDHYILAANDAVWSQLGVNKEEILGKYCPTVIHNLDQPFEGCPLEEAVKSGLPTVTELFDKATGRWVTSAVYPTRARTLSGKIIFLHIVIDITERKNTQEALRISRDQLHKLSSHLEKVREEEKRKIARDLHDETSQLISSLHAFLEAAAETLTLDVEKTRMLLKKAQSVSTTIHDEIHKLIYDLRPSLIDELGLIAAIENMQEHKLVPAGIKSTLKVAGKERRLTPEKEISLFRVVQETFTNVVQHSRAKRVKVNIYYKKDFVRVIVTDDGTGFDYKDAISSKEKVRGVGLIGMRERVELVGGKLEICSKPGAGTRTTVEIPHKEEAIDGKDQSASGR
jgi:PAS domain S-box-containing protein